MTDETMPRRIKIQSSPNDPTRLTISDAATGTRIPQVRGVWFSSPTPGDLPVVTLEILLADVEIIGELHRLIIDDPRTHTRRTFVLPQGTHEIADEPSASIGD